MYLLDWMFGTPSTVNAMYSYYTSRAVEDSGVVTALYNDGKTLAIMDSSFTTYYSPYTFELYGTQGTLLVRLDQNGWKYIFPKMRSRGLLRNMKGMSTKRYLGSRALFCGWQSPAGCAVSAAFLDRRLHKGRAGSV